MDEGRAANGRLSRLAVARSSVLKSLSKWLLGLLGPKQKGPFTSVKKRRIRFRKGDLEIDVDWSDRHDQR